MSEQIQAVRGMADRLPGQTAIWRLVTNRLVDVLQLYGFEEIDVPIVEKTGLFARTIGAATDIVEKEMYTFDDRNGESLTLRPEGTAGVVRAAIQHRLLHGNIQRLWYAGPMFRYERPQKGRYRQFHQIGAEAFGVADPLMDADMIAMTGHFWQQIGLQDIRLELNTLGSPEARHSYRTRLVEYLSDHAESLDEDSQRRLQTNPLRILDSKNPAMAQLVAAAPRLLDHLDAVSESHWQGLLQALDGLGLAYRVNPHLVRGLDYYCHTVFEWKTDRLGAQGTVCAGGRYDGLVAELSGPATPAIGFAMGLERLVALCEDSTALQPAEPAKVTFIGLDDASRQRALELLRECREVRPQAAMTLEVRGGSLGKQLQRADKAGAAIAILLGESERAAGTVTVKFLRAQRDQATVTQQELPAWLLRAVTPAEPASSTAP